MKRMKRMKYKIRYIYEIPENFKPEGALAKCFGYYLNFEDDFKLLADLGYLMVTSPETCKWLRSKTSLAEYIYWSNGGDDADCDKPYVPGGFWGPVENAF